MKIQAVVPDDLHAALESLGSEVVIDCGHTAVSYGEGKFRFGKEAEPSATEIKTLQMGLGVASELKASGRSAKIHICLSDSTRNLRAPSKRAELREAMERGVMFGLLPQSYQELISNSELEPDSVSYSLQTRNSNAFSNWMKSVKKQVAAAGQNHAAIYRKFNALFLRDMEDDLFGFTTPLLFNTETETRALNGTWWLNQDYEPSERDLIRTPLLLLKQLKIINLYSKSSGILCPGAYGGLLLNTRETSDHVAIYSRNDDIYIGEKVLRGVIAANILNPKFNRKCLQITLPRFLDSPEISLISPEDVRNAQHPAFDAFVAAYLESRLPAQYRIYA